MLGGLQSFCTVYHITVSIRTLSLLKMNENSRKTVSVAVRFSECMQLQFILH
jgi:hypothetical protein